MTNAIEEAREALGAFVDRPWMKCLSDDLSESHLISMDVRVADLRRASRALAALSAMDPPGPNGALHYAESLASSLARKHYPEAANLEPRPDLMGVLSQIDNMTTGLVRAPAPTVSGLTEEERAKLEVVRKRHEAAVSDKLWRGDYFRATVHADRAFLLSLLPDALKGEVKP
jgi:hypothetical protein